MEKQLEFPHFCAFRGQKIKTHENSKIKKKTAISAAAYIQIDFLLQQIIDK